MIELKLIRENNTYHVAKIKNWNVYMKNKKILVIEYNFVNKNVYLKSIGRLCTASEYIVDTVLYDARSSSTKTSAVGMVRPLYTCDSVFIIDSDEELAGLLI